MEFSKQRCNLFKKFLSSVEKQVQFTPNMLEIVINVGCLVINVVLHLVSKVQSSRFFMQLHMLSCIIMDWNFLKMDFMIHQMIGFVHHFQCTQCQISLIAVGLKSLATKLHLVDAHAAMARNWN